MLISWLVCVLHVGLYIIKCLYILNSLSDIDFKFGLKSFYKKLIDYHHFDLITWLMYVLQTRIQVLYRLLFKLKTRVVVHLQFRESLFFIEMYFWWK